MPEQHYRPETYTAAGSVGYMVRRLYAIIAERIERALGAHDFTLTQWIVLMYVRDGVAHTACEIAREFHHDSGALTRVIDQLERRGLLERRRSLRDRRVVELELTPSGEELIRALLPVVVGQLNEALSPLSAAEFQQFRAYLSRILGHLQASAAPEPLLEAPLTPTRATVAATAGRGKRKSPGGRK